MIPDKLQGFMCYNSGSQMIGVADVVLPTLAHMTDTISGAGILGEVDTPSIGNFQSLTTTINWRSLTNGNIDVSGPNTKHFDFRGSMQFYNKSTGRQETQALKVVMRCNNKSTTLGNLGIAIQMGTATEYEVTYILIAIEGQTVKEIDKFNHIYRGLENGRMVDYLAKVRQDLGLS